MFKKVVLYLIICFFVVCQVIAKQKILIITHNFNRPDFIEIQHATFKKFLQDDYEYVVFNDATDSTLVQQINNICNKLQIEWIRVPLCQDIHRNYAFSNTFYTK